jgi:hypothetical protein
VRSVTVVVSDPWSFTAEDGSNVFTAGLRASHEDLMLLEMAGGLYVATPRSDGNYSLIPVTEEQSAQAAPWGREEWRGGRSAPTAEIRSV